ncbi:hypothetical protein ACFVUW_10470 [Streptomyces xiamenensis]|uniref:hypothetical protein n=1 Tax=Streptomyces xiamenensis TaxID=408015 RepID=UPI0036F0507F
MSVPAKQAEPATLLGTLLEEANLTPTQLAAEVSQLTGRQHHPAQAFRWRSQVVPRTPTRRAIAAVLTSAMDREVTPDDIWPGLPDQPSDRIVSSQWTVPELLRLSIEQAEWAGNTAGLRTTKAAQSVLRGFHSHTERWEAVTAGACQPDGQLADSAQTLVTAYRRMDDNPAAIVGSDLRIMVDAAAAGIVRILRRHPGRQRHITQLLQALAHLSQLSGWIAAEIGHLRTADHRLLLGLRAAHAAGDRPLGAHILADLAFTAACSRRPRVAALMADGAAQAVGHASAAAQAAVWGRVAFARAVAGDPAGMHEAKRHALRAATVMRPAADAPWAYYLTPEHVEVQCGYAHVALARHSGQNRTMLVSGHQLMESAGTQGYAAGPPDPRRCGWEMAWVAWSLMRQRRLDGACEAANSALDHYSTVPTARTRILLTDLHTSMARYAGTQVVESVLPRLAQVIGR